VRFEVDDPAAARDQGDGPRNITRIDVALNRLMDGTQPFG
jgi:hypothetical protein